MSDDLESELSVPVAPAPAPAPAPVPVTAIAVDPVAREAAVQEVLADQKAVAAVAQLDAAAKVPPPAPVPEAKVVVPAELEPEEPKRELSPLERLEACEAHIEELVRHLAQSFGGEFAAKKDRMGV